MGTGVLAVLLDSCVCAVDGGSPADAGDAPEESAAAGSSGAVGAALGGALVASGEDAVIGVRGAAGAAPADPLAAGFEACGSVPAGARY